MKFTRSAYEPPVGLFVFVTIVATSISLSVTPGALTGTFFCRSAALAVEVGPPEGCVLSDDDLLDPALLHAAARRTIATTVTTTRARMFPPWENLDPAGDSKRSRVVIHDDPGARRQRLARQHPALLDFLGRERIVHPHADRTVLQVRHACCAASGLALIRGTQAAAAGRLQQGVPRLVPQRLFAPVEPDDQSLGRHGRLDRRRLVRHDESFHEPSLGLDAEGRKTRFDDVHVRTGTTNVEVAVRVLADERRAAVRVEEALLGVDMVMHRQPAARRGAQAVERVAEDHRVTTAVRVDEPNRTGGRRQRA